MAATGRGSPRVLIVASPPLRPLLVFDGDCGFCKGWVARWRARSNDAIDFEPYQQVASRFPEIPVESFKKGVQLSEPNGRVSSNAVAVFRSLALAGRKRWLVWLYDCFPSFAAISESVYRFIANHRSGMAMLDSLVFGADFIESRYARSRSIFLRCLGLVYLCAFLSLWVQVDGLIGSRGILPAADFLNANRTYVAKHGYATLPTLFWFSASDRSIQLLCGAGVACSVLLMAGRLPLPMVAILWMLYLSFVNVGQDFLSFQWDGLLLETGFLALLIAPLALSLSRAKHPPWGVGWFLMRWLLFRLMVSSGIVKLISGDENWISWKALRYHYETQPLPPWTAWYMHHLPDWFGQMSVAFVLVVEIFAPLLIFLPRRLRMMGFWLLVLLQLLIALTGNYGLFNLLTFVLCLTLVDDDTWAKWKCRLLRLFGQTTNSPRPRVDEDDGWHRYFRVTIHALLSPLAIALFILSTSYFIDAFGTGHRWSEPIVWTRQQAQPFEISSRYGLFAVMTTERPEIIIEGSDDGITWREYEFIYKPGDVNRRPSFTTPHMPRLDWQMWFAALGDWRSLNNEWVLHFMQRLLQGSPSVTGLMKTNPFPDNPPKRVRAILYDYHFSPPGSGKAWWTRNRVGPYGPEWTLEDFEP